MRGRRWRGVGAQHLQNSECRVPIHGQLFDALVGANAFQRPAADNAVHVAFQMAECDQMLLKLHALLHG